jgi:TolB-like protein/class 3 adenylate cyclase/rhodanese-related sulfurtransferase
MEAASAGLPATREPRRLAAFVYADMVGYSRLIGEDDAGTYARLALLRHALIDPALERYGGMLVNTAGDSLLMAFSSVFSAVRFAVEIQTRMPEFDHGIPPDRRIRFRMGINAGDAIVDGEHNIHGDSINVAARLEAICPPGCVCVSAIVRNHVQGLDLRFEPMGALELKNIARPVEAFVVRLDRPRTALHHQRRSWGITASLVLLCAMLAGLGGWWLVAHRAPDAKPVADDGLPPVSIAVLPFTNLGSDRNEDYLADGIAEDLTTDLSHLEGAFVVARESAFTYRGKEVDIREVGRQLGVRYVLEGSVRKLGESVRINAQLIATHDGTHVWAERFDQPLRDLQAGQDSTVQRIGAALNIKFDAAKRAPRTSASDPTAYDLVLRARAVLQEPRSDGRDTIAAGYFEQALRLDPTSVAAKAGVASLLIASNRSVYRAFRLIGEAQMVAPTSPDVLAALFRLLIWQHHNEEAVGVFRRLLDIDPSTASAAAEFVPSVWTWGRPQDAVPLLERTARLNPLSADRDVLYVTLGRLLLMLGRDAEATGWLERGLDLVAQMPPSKMAERQAGDYVIERTKLFLAIAYAFTGRLDEAHSMLASALSSPRSMDLTVREFLNGIPRYFDVERQAQEQRLAEGMRMAGLRDHLDETADSGVVSTASLGDELYAPTPLTVPGGTTIRTEELVRLLETKPLVLSATATSVNPTIPGAISVGLDTRGNLSDQWQAALGILMSAATGGDKHRPIVVFSYSINRWPARNLALRLIALGYTNVYWYRGGWEAWDSHDLPQAPLAFQLGPTQN